MARSIEEQRRLRITTAVATVQANWPDMNASERRKAAETLQDVFVWLALTIKLDGAKASTHPYGPMLAHVNAVAHELNVNLRR